MAHWFPRIFLDPGNRKGSEMKTFQICLGSALLALLAACGGGGSGDNGASAAPPPPASTAAVDVTVFDNLGRFVAGAIVTSAAAQATTDASGRATLAVATGSEQTLTIDKDGFAQQVKVLNLAASASSGTLQTMVIARQPALTISAIEGGGSATGHDGVKVTFPPGALVDAAGHAVSGAVDMLMTPVNVADVDVGAFPGLFEGIPTGAARQPIVSYGSTELVPQQRGAKLQLGAGKSAVIELPIYVDHHQDGSAVAVGDTIPLWSLDPATGLWTQEGSGTVVDSPGAPLRMALRATIAHFSWWNVDQVSGRGNVVLTVNVLGATAPAGTQVPVQGTVVAGSGPSSIASTLAPAGGTVTVQVPASTTTTRLSARLELGGQVCSGSVDVSPLRDTTVSATIGANCVDVPVPTIVRPAAISATNSRSTTAVDVAVDGPTPDSVAILVDGKPVATTPAQFFYRLFWDSSTFGEGSHTLTATATRLGSTRTSAPVTVVVDRTAPQILGFAPAAAIEVVRATTLTVDFNEPVTPVPLSLANAVRLTVTPPGSATPQPVAADVSLDTAGLHLTVQPTVELPIGVLGLSWGGLADAAGNAVSGTIAASWNVSRTLQLGSSFNVNRRMRMTIDAAGVPYVVGQFHGDDVSVLRFDGSDFVPMGPRANDFATAGDPQIAVAPDGRVYVAFEQDTAVPNKGQVVVRTFDAASSTWQPVGPPFPLSVSGSLARSTPHVLVDGARRPILLFVSDDGLFSLEGWRFDGTAWQSLGVFGDSFFYDFTARLDSSGNPVVLYLKGTSGSNAKQISLARFDGTAWGLVSNGFDSVPDATGSIGEPALALAADGSQWVAWSKFDGDGHVVATHLAHVVGTTVTDGNLPPDFRVSGVGLTTFGNEPVILGDIGASADVRRFHGGAWEPKALMAEADHARFDVYPFGGQIVVGMNGVEGPSRVSRFSFPP
jgi:Bacterial Ig-like domain